MAKLSTTINRKTQITRPVCFSCRHYSDNKNHNCTFCGQCRRICLCRKRAGIGNFKVPTARDSSIGSSSMFIHSKRAIGLELELSNFGHWIVREKDKGQIPNGPNYFIDHDGSVKPSTLEAVISPMAGDQMIIPGLNAIATHVWNNNCEVNETCGYHVHVDARDFTWHDIQKMLILWMAIESQPELWMLCGRGPTSFSETWVSWWKSRTRDKIAMDIKKFKAQVIRMLYNVDTESYKEHLTKVHELDSYQEALHRAQSYIKAGITGVKLPRKVDYVNSINTHKSFKANRGWNRAVRSRYMDLNIHSWLYRGTLEYRLAAGTVDPNDIRMWPLFCLWLIEAVSRTSIKIILREVSENKNVIKGILQRGGFPIPSITGEKLYPMSPYLIDWIMEKTR